MTDKVILDVCCGGRMFDVLVEHYPNNVEREQLGMEAEIATTGGSFGTYLSMLRRNGLIEVSGTTIKASEALFI